MTRALAAFAALVLSSAPLLAEPIPSASPEEVGLSSARLGRIRPALRALLRSRRDERVDTSFPAK